MGIYRSTNPTDWNAVDGIIIDEVSPPPSVNGVPANIAILVGQFERGPAATLTEVGSVGELYELFGNNLNYGGNVALLNKRFGSLKVVRAVAAAAIAATKVFNHSATATITFTAKYLGAYGNNITVKIEAGSTQGSKYTIHDGNSGSVWPDEVYDNVLITSSSATLSALFGNSNLIAVPTVQASANEPDTAAATALLTGSDGSIADTDYQTAITAQELEAAGNVVFLDAYNSTRVGYLKTSMANTTDRMALICGTAGDSVSTAVAAVASDRDTDGRLIYAFPYVYTTVNGVNTKVNPCSFYASLLSQTAPNVDPASAVNVQYLAGINGLELNLKRSDYVSLVAAGISAFENDQDLGIKVKSGVVTQISNTAKLMVARRRMADYIGYSVAKYLKNFQNAVNSAENQNNAVAGIVQFNRNLEASGLVPTDAEVQNGKASIVDGKSLNTNGSIAAGYFKILYKRRIYSSMRYLIFQAEIGESVVVTVQ
jgi:hypothetical protein